MELKDFYSKLGVSLDIVLKRLISEDRVKKYLNLIINEPNFALLDTAYEQRDYEEMFKASHAIKGLCLNLELAPIAETSAQLMEYLRPGKTPVIDDAVVDEYYQKLNSTYTEVRGMIAQL